MTATPAASWHQPNRPKIWILGRGHQLLTDYLRLCRNDPLGPPDAPQIARELSTDEESVNRLLAPLLDLGFVEALPLPGMLPRYRVVSVPPVVGEVC